MIEAIHYPERVERQGIVSLGLSDDAVNDISLVHPVIGQWHWLTPSEKGQVELPVWIDHVGSIDTRWRRYDFEQNPSIVTAEVAQEKLTAISDPRK